MGLIEKIAATILCAVTTLLVWLVPNGLSRANKIAWTAFAIILAVLFWLIK